MNLSVKRLALAAVAAAVLCVGPASSAVAAEPAIWTPKASMKQAGTLEFKILGSSAPAVTCQIKAEGAVDGSQYWPHPATRHQCSSGYQVTFSLWQFGQKEGTKYSVDVGYTPFEGVSPWGGQWKQKPVVVPFVNGSGTKMSTLQFSNTIVGTIGGSYLLATGTLTASTIVPAGGLITLK